MLTLGSKINKNHRYFKYLLHNEIAKLRLPVLVFRTLGYQRASKYPQLISNYENHVFLKFQSQKQTKIIVKFKLTFKKLAALYPFQSLKHCRFLQSLFFKMEFSDQHMCFSKRVFEIPLDLVKFLLKMILLSQKILKFILSDPSSKMYTPCTDWKKMNVKKNIIYFIVTYYAEERFTI